MKRTILPVATLFLMLGVCGCDPDPWQVPGENRGEAVDRIERKLNETCAKPPFLRYEIHPVRSDPFP